MEIRHVCIFESLLFSKCRICAGKVFGMLLLWFHILATISLGTCRPMFYPSWRIGFCERKCEVDKSCLPQILEFEFDENVARDESHFARKARRQDQKLSSDILNFF